MLIPMARFNAATLQGAAIDIPDRAAAPVKFAAEELQRYVRQTTGVRIPVMQDVSLRGRDTLVLGAQAGTPAPPQPVRPLRPLKSRGSFTIIPETTRVTLSAASPRALLDAVYALLKQFGCRWSLHGPHEETVPRVTGDVELRQVTHTPHFAVRGYCSDIMTWHYTQREYFNDRLDDDRAFIDWMGKSGANAFFYIRHPFDTQLTIPELLPEFQKRGIDVEYGGHVLPLLLPRELYHEHPEYFPQLPDGTRTDHGNLCSSNTAALATATANAVQYVCEYPEMSALHIWGADLWRGG